MCQVTNQPAVATVRLALQAAHTSNLLHYDSTHNSQLTKHYRSSLLYIQLGRFNPTLPGCNLLPCIQTLSEQTQKIQSERDSTIDKNQQLWTQMEQMQKQMQKMATTSMGKGQVSHWGFFGQPKHLVII